MKRRIQIIGLLLLLSFAACNSPRREARRMMVRAEALADTLPDSTVLLIDSVSHMEVYFSERSRMEMALLHADALFRGVSIDDDDIKEVLDHKLPTPNLERAAGYFAGKKDYAKAAQAALYSGYVQQYYKEKAKAMESYKDAEQYGTLADDRYLVAKARYMIGEMLYDDYLSQESLAMLKLAANEFGSHNEEHAMTLNMMAISYTVLQQFDSAVICLDQSRFYAEQCQSKKMKVKILNNYAVLYRIQEKYDQAIDCVKQIDSNYDSLSMFMSFLNYGKIYAASGNVDSASYYYKRLEELLPLVNLKDETVLSAYRSMSRCAEKTGDFERALQYRKRYEGILSSIVNHTEESVVYGVQRKYDYDALQNAIDKKTAHIKQMVAIGLVLLLGILLFLLYRLAQRNKRDAEINANLFHFMHQNEELKLRHEAYRKEDDAKSQQLADLLSEKLQMMQKLDYYLNNQGDKKPLRELEKELFEGKGHIKQFMEVFDMLYPGLRDTVKAKYPQMTEQEYLVCLLSRLQLSRAEEADLLGISTSVLDKIRGKVHRMMAEEKE